MAAAAMAAAAMATAAVAAVATMAAATTVKTAFALLNAKRDEQDACSRWQPTSGGGSGGSGSGGSGGHYRRSSRARRFRSKRSLDTLSEFAAAALAFLFLSDTRANAHARAHYEASVLNGSGDVGGGNDGSSSARAFRQCGRRAPNGGCARARTLTRPPHVLERRRPLAARN